MQRTGALFESTLLLPMAIVAGTGEQGFLDGECAKATFKGPMGIAVDADGVVYVADGEVGLRVISIRMVVTSVAHTHLHDT